MARCMICLEGLKLPVSIPCGHVFCSECLLQIVHAIKPYSEVHACPTCRAFFTLSPPTSSTSPHHPESSPIRRIYLDHTEDAEASGHTPPQVDTSNSTAASSSPSPTSIELNRLKAENQALRVNCAMWRKRAELHSASNLGFLELSKAAKSAALKLEEERDELQHKYDALKEQVIKYEDDDLGPNRYLTRSWFREESPSWADWESVYRSPILEEDLPSAIKQKISW